MAVVFGSSKTVFDLIPDQKIRQTVYPEINTRHKLYKSILTESFEDCYDFQFELGLKKEFYDFSMDYCLFNAILEKYFLPPMRNLSDHQRKRIIDGAIASDVKPFLDLLPTLSAHRKEYLRLHDEYISQFARFALINPIMIQYGPAEHDPALSFDLDGDIVESGPRAHIHYFDEHNEQLSEENKADLAEFQRRNPYLAATYASEGFTRQLANLPKNLVKKSITSCGGI